MFFTEVLIIRSPSGPTKRGLNDERYVYSGTKLQRNHIFVIKEKFSLFESRLNIKSVLYTSSGTFVYRAKCWC